MVFAAPKLLPSSDVPVFNPIIPLTTLVIFPIIPPPSASPDAPSFPFINFFSIPLIPAFPPSREDSLSFKASSSGSNCSCRRSDIFIISLCMFVSISGTVFFFTSPIPVDSLVPANKSETREPPLDTSIPSLSPFKVLSSASGAVAVCASGEIGAGVATGAGDIIGAGVATGAGATGAGVTGAGVTGAGAGDVIGAGVATGATGATGAGDVIGSGVATGAGSDSLGS